jgi:uncharacterized protein with NRDE domain
MCLILLAWRAHPEYPFVFAGNRDEAYDRPSASADFWHDDSRIFGGRDLEKGGTWLGLSLSGRIAAVTNYRERPAVRNAPRSRGELTTRFLRGTEDPHRFLVQVTGSAAEYGAFNLIVGDSERLWNFSNRGDGLQQIPPGVHGLSNHLIDTPWPKVTHGKQRLAQLLSADESRLTSGLFDILLDRTPAPDAELPDTGVGPQRERELSSSFVAGDRYGTRASTVLLIDRRNEVLFIERAFGPGGNETGTTRREFQVEAT